MDPFKLWRKKKEKEEEKTHIKPTYEIYPSSSIEETKTLDNIFDDSYIKDINSEKNPYKKYIPKKSGIFKEDEDKSDSRSNYYDNFFAPLMPLPSIPIIYINKKLHEGKIISGSRFTDLLKAFKNRFTPSYNNIIENIEDKTVRSKITEDDLEHIFQAYSTIMLIHKDRSDDSKQKLVDGFYRIMNEKMSQCESTAEKISILKRWGTQVSKSIKKHGNELRYVNGFV
jgi:hypothetical protein